MKWEKGGGERKDEERGKEKGREGENGRGGRWGERETIMKRKKWKIDSSSKINQPTNQPTNQLNKFEQQAKIA